MLQKVKIFSEADFLDYNIRPKLPSAVDHVEMSNFESAFICGIIRKYKPKNVLEVGISAGGTSALILTAFNEYGLNSSLHSVDTGVQWYRDHNKQVGWQANAVYGEANNWILSLGKWLPEIIEGFNTQFDLCILDTAHLIPGEILDFAVVLPFMSKNGIIILHDTMLHLQFYQMAWFCTATLLSCCSGNKIICFDDEKNQLPNIAAIQITDDTIAKICDVFLAMGLRWQYHITYDVIMQYYMLYDKYYGKEAADYFKMSYEWNEEKLTEYNVPDPWADKPWEPKSVFKQEKYSENIIPSKLESKEKKEMENNTCLAHGNFTLEVRPDKIIITTN